MLLSQIKIDQSRKQRKLNLFTNYPAVPAEMFLGRHVAIFGTTGSGKSVTAATLAEEMDNAGFLLAIIDPEGDYTGLQQFRPSRFVVYGRKFSENKTTMDGRQITNAVSRILDDDKSVILTLSDYRKEERAQITYSFLTQLYDRVSFERPKRAIFVFLDEIHQIAPQNKPSLPELAQLIEDCAKLGRKRGLGLVAMSQRPSDVNKNVSTQCDMKLMHRVHYPHDIDAYNSLMNFRTDSLKQNRQIVQDTVMSFDKGECWFSFPTFNDYDNGLRKVKVRMRYSKHTSPTPGVEVLG